MKPTKSHTCHETRGSRLRHVRTELGLPQTELARRLGITREYLGRYENDRQQVNDQTAILFATITKSNPKYILDGMPPIWHSPPPVTSADCSKLSPVERQCIVEWVLLDQGSANLLEMLRELATTQRLKCISEAINIFVDHCDVLRTQKAHFLRSRVPAIILHHALPQIQLFQFNDVIQWCMEAKGSNRDPLSDLAEDARSGERLEQAVGTIIQEICKFISEKNLQF